MAGAEPGCKPNPLFGDKAMNTGANNFTAWWYSRQASPEGTFSDMVHNVVKVNTVIGDHLHPTGILSRLGRLDRREILEPYVVEGAKTHGSAKGESIAHNGMESYVMDIGGLLRS